ncbi:hypothetical protein IFM89_012009 [Coptis chinensis]|uniref:S-protein homolog n=1 Tax=Coptis chinensis TaxID=261450 RepID=A0A835IYI2_9MAGN|nr:hypothetical protein IFM89_012009 [Coptis chinensis]
MDTGLNKNLPRGYKLTLLAILLFISWQCSIVSGFKLRSGLTYVNLKNDIAENITLHAHCRSADDDLGPKIISYGQIIEWWFIINLFETTLFWCNLWYVADSEGGVVSGSGDIFRVKQLKGCDDKCDCYRAARKDGVHSYKLHPQPEDYILFGWMS